MAITELRDTAIDLVIELIRSGDADYTESIDAIARRDHTAATAISRYANAAGFTFDAAALEAVHGARVRITASTR